MNVFNQQGTASEWELIAQILAGPFTGQYLYNQLPGEPFASVYFPYGPSLPHRYGVWLIPADHPHFPYGLTVELDALG